MAPDGHEMDEAGWHDPEARALMLRLDGRSPATGLREIAANVTLLMLINAASTSVSFTLPAMHDEHWRVLVDTARHGGRVVAGGSEWKASAHSLTLLAVERDRIISSARIVSEGAR